MKETLYQVAEAISEAQPEYREKYIPVVARVHVLPSDRFLPSLVEDNQEQA